MKYGIVYFLGDIDYDKVLPEQLNDDQRKVFDLVEYHNIQKKN